MLKPLVYVLACAIIGLNVLAYVPQTRLEITPYISENLDGFVHWVILQGIALYLSFANVIVTVYYGKKLRKERDIFRQKHQDISSSNFIEMRML